MKHFLHLAGVIYVCFAIFIAHAAILSAETTRLAAKQSNQQITQGYVVELWMADSCLPCQLYKQTELPLLMKLGYEVKMCDATSAEDVAKVPTVRLYYDDDLVTQKVYWRAASLHKYVVDRQTPKG